MTARKPKAAEDAVATTDEVAVEQEKSKSASRKPTAFQIETAIRHMGYYGFDTLVYDVDAIALKLAKAKTVTAEEFKAIARECRRGV